MAALCNGAYPCPNYGLAASCPPNVEGPVEFRKWQTQSDYSITVKIELPVAIMFSDARKGVMQLLHEIVAAVEQKAIEIGFGMDLKALLLSCSMHFSIRAGPMPQPQHCCDEYDRY